MPGQEDRKGSGAKPRPPPLFSAMAALQRGDGLLRVVAGTEEATISVMQGRVVCVEHPRVSSREVVALLVNSGVISEEKVQKAASRYRNLPVEAAIKLEGLVSAATISNAREFLSHEVLMDLLLRNDVEVTTEPLGPTASETCAMPVRFLLREAQDRAKQLPAIRKVVQSDDQVFVRTFTNTSPNAVRRLADLPLAANERQVLFLLDGHRSVAEVARAGGQSTFRVAKAIKSLVEAGLARPIPPGQAHPSPPKVSMRKVVSRITHIVTILLLLAIILRTVLLVSGVEPSAPKVMSWDFMLQQSRAMKVVQAAMVYALLHNTPAQSLDDLLQEGLLNVQLREPASRDNSR